MATQQTRPTPADYQLVGVPEEQSFSGKLREALKGQGHGAGRDHSRTGDGGSRVVVAMPQVLMTGVGTDIFDLEVFLAMLVIHVLEPVSTLFVVLRWGCTRARNLQLLQSGICTTWTWPPERGMEVFWLLMPFFNWYPALIWLNLVLFFRYPEDFRSANVAFAEVVGIPGCLILVHRAMVALKYAMLTPAEYELFMNAPVEDAKRWGSQLQLISGWLPLPDDILDRELDLACWLVGEELTGAWFLHEVRDYESSQAWAIWQAMLDGDPRWPTCQLDRGVVDPSVVAAMKEAVEPLPNSAVTRRMCARTVLRLLIQKAAVEVLRKPRNVLAVFLSLLPAFLPLAWRWSTTYQETASFREGFYAAVGGNSHLAKYCVAVAVASTWLFYGLGYRFLSVGVCHLHRMYLIMEWLTQFARPNTATFPNLPRLQLRGAVTASNAKTILLCINVVLKFGERYKRRMESYVGVGLGAAIVGLACVLVRVVLDSPDEDAGADDARAGPVLDAFTCIVLYTIVLITGMAFSMISFGCLSNSFVSLLASHITTARWRGLAAGDEAVINNDALLSLAVDRLNCLSETEPVSIAGLKATMDLGYSLLSVVGTAVAFILGKMLKLSLPV